MKFIYAGETMNPYFASLSTLIAAYRRDLRNKRNFGLEDYRAMWRARYIANAIANEDNQ